MLFVVLFVVSFVVLFVVSVSVVEFVALFDTEFIDTPLIIISLQVNVACKILVPSDEEAIILKSSILNPNFESSSISSINPAIPA